MRVPKNPNIGLFNELRPVIRISSTQVTIVLIAGDYWCRGVMGDDQGFAIKRLRKFFG